MHSEVFHEGVQGVGGEGANYRMMFVLGSNSITHRSFEDVMWTSLASGKTGLIKDTSVSLRQIGGTNPS